MGKRCPAGGWPWWEQQEPHVHPPCAEDIAAAWWPGQVSDDSDAGQVVKDHCELESCEASDGNMRLLAVNQESEVRSRLAAGRT